MVSKFLLNEGALLHCSSLSPVAVAEVLSLLQTLKIICRRQCDLSEGMEGFFFVCFDCFRGCVALFLIRESPG